MDLQNKILSVIQENLTASQLGVLKDHFEQAAKNEKELEGLRNYKKNTEEMLKEITKERDILKKEQLEVMALSELNKKNAADLAKRNLELDVTIAKANLDACKNSYMEMKDLMATVFRNPKFVHVQQHDEHHEGYQHANGWVNSHDVRKTYTTKTEQE